MYDYIYPYLHNTLKAVVKPVRMCLFVSKFYNSCCLSTVILSTFNEMCDTLSESVFIRTAKHLLLPSVYCVRLMLIIMNYSINGESLVINLFFRQYSAEFCYLC